MRRMLSASGRLPGYEKALFEYLPSEPNGHATRLVALLPGQKHTPIKCKSVHVLLDEEPDYEALSYTWGDPESIKSIFLESRPFPVRENLYHALYHLRRQNVPRYLWIDALSIDQINDEEKSVQVQQMKIIYEKATRVLVWLGQADDDSDMAMNLISGDLDPGTDEAEVPHDFDYLESTINQSDQADVEGSNNIEYRVAPLEKESANQNSRSISGYIHVVEREQLGISVNRETKLDQDRVIRPKSNSSRKEAWIAFNKLTQRPWWNRVWVLQEVSLPRSDPLVICGERSVEWSRLIEFCNSADIVRTYPFTLAFQTRISVLHQTQGYSLTRLHMQTKAPSMNLGLLLQSSLTLDFSDPRDKVYALLSLAREKDRLALIPDYSLSTTQVYIKTILHLVNTTGKLDMLCLNTNSSNPDFVPHMLPSWVPDWTLMSSRPRPIWGSDLYHASKTHRAVMRLLPETQAHIEVVGICADSVVGVSDVIDGSFIDEDLSGLNMKLDSLEKLLMKTIRERLKSIPTPQNSEEDVNAWWQTLSLDPDPRNSDAFWRTLTANVLQTERKETPAPESFAEMFEILRYGPEKHPRRLHQDGLTSVQPIAPRLQTPHQSEVPAHFEAHLSLTQRKLRYISPLVTAMTVLSDRRFFVTQKGYMGIASKDICKGDIVTILLGSDMPFILRDHGNGDALQLISEAYVHGLMNGEIFDSIPKDKLTDFLRWFRLG